MTSYEYRAPVDMAADELFGFMARPESLPQHLPGLETTTPEVDTGGRRISWEEGGYRGEVVVVDDGPGRSQVAIAVKTEHGGDVRRELEEAVAALAHRATGEAESSATADENSWY
ncbi:SRPBCC family protein [Saccharothrix sp. BKS2]|uniref:SRPBCC family protein n=1 Tax=Saccharothrix sp. BKS2 TaxID=3064400 RepID=UPI0039ECC737